MPISTHSNTFLSMGWLAGWLVYNTNSISVLLCFPRFTSYLCVWKVKSYVDNNFTSHSTTQSTINTLEGMTKKKSRLLLSRRNISEITKGIFMLLCQLIVAVCLAVCGNVQKPFKYELIRYRYCCCHPLSMEFLSHKMWSATNFVDLSHNIFRMPKKFSLSLSHNDDDNNMIQFNKWIKFCVCAYKSDILVMNNEYT